MIKLLRKLNHSKKLNKKGSSVVETIIIISAMAVISVVVVGVIVGLVNKHLDNENQITYDNDGVVKATN